MDAARRRWPPAELRAGDADRQAAVAELQRHYVEGRLSSDELGERVAQALAARTFGELSAPLADLPPLHAQRLATDQNLRDRGWDSHDRGWDSPDRGWDSRDACGWDLRDRGWPSYLLSPPFGAVLILVGLLAMVWIFAWPSLHLGVVPFWPILIWAFFFIGRPHRGGPRGF
jgi:Domain of unknown function (DUF1707)